MGKTAERLNDYKSAIRFYKEAFAMEPASARTWYLIQKNMGFCLNTLGRFAECEGYCRRAIEIDSQPAPLNDFLHRPILGLRSTMNACD